MWSFIDFLVTQAHKGEEAEFFLFYVGTAAFIFFFMCVLPFVLG